MNLSRTIQTITLVLLVTGIIALALGGYLHPISRLALAPFISIQTWLATRFQAIQDFIAAPRDQALLQWKNAELEAQVASLQAQIIELQQQNAQMQVLSALLDFARTHPDNEYLSAIVIGRDPSPFLHYLIINRGSDNGLRRGMPVVSQNGLIGRISGVTAGAARVQLITDPSVSLNVLLQPSQTNAILGGTITGEVVLSMIPQDISIQAGELVLTSGLGGNYPPNILIGQVTGVRKRPVDLYQTATVQTVVDFSKLDIVLIITNFQPIDFSPLVPTPGTE